MLPESEDAPDFGSEVDNLCRFPSRDPNEEYRLRMLKGIKDPLGKSGRYVGRHAQMVANASCTNNHIPRRFSETSCTLADSEDK